MILHTSDQLINLFNISSRGRLGQHIEGQHENINMPIVFFFFAQHLFLQLIVLSLHWFLETVPFTFDLPIFTSNNQRVDGSTGQVCSGQAMLAPKPETGFIFWALMPRQFPLLFRRRRQI